MSKGKVITSRQQAGAFSNQIAEEAINDYNKKVGDADLPYLPLMDEKNIDDFYKALGMPFFNSLTKIQVENLSELQNEIWDLHMEFKRLMILKSQKIGISSLCILITLYHALSDCAGMELIINAQSDEQAKTHAQDLRRILMASNKYRGYLITKQYASLGLLKDEVTKIHTIWIHNRQNPRLATKIIITGMSPGALLSHKRVAFIWSSDMTISEQTPDRLNQVWAAMQSRLANSLGYAIVECPARAPSGPVYDTYEKFQQKEKIGETIDPVLDFKVVKFTYKRGIDDGFFTKAFIESEMKRLGPVFGTFYTADFFSSGSTWYKEEHFANVSDEVTDLILQFTPEDDRLSDLTSN